MYEHPMSDPRYRYNSGRRSPTFNPARASLPIGVGYGASYTGDIHAVPTARYDATIPRRQGEGHHRAPTTTTITTYNVTKEPLTRNASTRDQSRTRHRSSTIDTGSVKPIIVTTNHSRPHDSGTSHRSRRPESPNRDPYRSSEETYYSQPASSIRARSHNRHHSASIDNDEFYRARERLGGDDRLRAPARPHSRGSMYVNTPKGSIADFAVDDYEYTKPSDLARYDLDHDRPRSRSRRDSFDRGANYYRPSVVVSNDIGGRPDGRRAPPTSGALDRYNKHAASGIYDRPALAMPALPAAPIPPPPIDPARRSGTLDVPASPTIDRRSSRPRPVSLYQDAPPRMGQLDDMFRPRDDERIHRDHRRDRGDEFARDDTIASRGFGLRPELMDHAESRRPVEPERRDLEDRRPRRDESREPKRRSDEDLDKLRGRHERRPSELRDRPARVEESRDRKESKGEKVRDKVVAGLGVAAAAIGLGAPKDKEEDRDAKISPRRHRDSDLEHEALGSRAAERYKPRETDNERKSPPREEPIVVESRRDAPRDKVSPRDESTSREREREREKAKERDRDHDRERERQRNRRDADLQSSRPKDGGKDNSDHSDDSAGGTSRRRRRASTAFNPNDTKGLMDLKALLAAMDDNGKPREKDRSTPKDRTEATNNASTAASSASEKQAVSRRDLDRARDESRGREMAAEAEQKQVRVVSPPRDKGDSRPIKGILKQPTSQFPEDTNPVREGVAPHKDDKTKKDVPSGARWTKINRRVINPEALTIGKERFEVRDDFVIVLRVLSKEEIQAYATATAQLREMRRKEFEQEHGGDREQEDRGRDRDDEERRRRHRRRDEEERERRDREADRDRHRRHRQDDTQENDRPRAIEYDDGSRHLPHRSHRDRDLETIASSTDDRR
ncbi:uncharacterized protein JN550_001517 [Neoarthrinium moseri]|uniref:uncharacterized protein n=1 Tax=Neoarthrinium moseri TaxID=1658444 RepID=UPI001FDB0B01|nr:uncharacterized protein JN550_001517 [Neoarthrinium moseri]KAI1876021.1 hypothetical protein JN550_001517 [Neoarthrinium moseri]